MKNGFVRVELNKTVWEVPDVYSALQPVGSGAYGQVWYEHVSFYANAFKSCDDSVIIT